MTEQLSPTLELTCALIKRRSVSPEDDGCQDLLTARLQTLGFTVCRLPFGKVENFWALRGEEGPILCFAGHTDVVPTGELADWDSDPFEPSIVGDLLYGRGAADMKGSLAAMVTATETFIQQHPQHLGRIAFLITSDEEGPAVDGTVRVVDWLSDQAIIPDWCIVGEPSSSTSLGDVVKNGRRGSLNGRLTVRGIQGHVAYPQQADNPIHRLLPALTELTAIEWDQGNEYFPATSFQVSNIRAGTGATNVIPGEMTADFNFRFSTENTATTLREKVEDVLRRYSLNYHLDWQLSGEPFLTPAGSLVRAAAESIREHCGLDTQLSTTGGTSDGRFIARLGGQVVELGPVNASIHKINEHVRITDLDRLAAIYLGIMKKLFGV